MAEGRHGSMNISDFIEVVRRNAYRPHDMRFLVNRWGRYQGVPDGTCTLVDGGKWTEGTNLPFPILPENNVIDEETERIEARGWRPLLATLMRERTIKHTDEMRDMLGDVTFDRVTKGLGCI